MSMHVRIVCPEFSAFEGNAVFASIPSTDGEIGIMMHHASSICTIEPGYIRIAEKALGTVEHTFAVTRGYAQVANDELIILVNRAKDVSTVDKDEVQAEIQGFEEKLSVLSENDATRAYLYNEIAWCKLLLGA